MGIIIEVTKDYVYIKEEAVYYKISKELFMFEPKVGDTLKVLKTTSGQVIKIIKIKGSNIKTKRLKSTRFFRVTSLYSFILGIMIILTINDTIHLGQDYYPTMFFIGIILMVFSITNNIIRTTKAKFKLAVITTAFYLVILIVGIVLFLTQRFYSGSIVSLLSIIPLIFNSFYFYYLKKEENPAPKRFSEFK